MSMRITFDPATEFGQNLIAYSRTKKISSVIHWLEDNCNDPWIILDEGVEFYSTTDGVAFAMAFYDKIVLSWGGEGRPVFQSRSNSQTYRRTISRILPSNSFWEPSIARTSSAFKKNLDENSSIVRPRVSRIKFK